MTTFRGWHEYMAPHKRGGPIMTPGKQYWYVYLDEQNWSGEPDRIPFPTKESAERFARVHQEWWPHRLIYVEKPEDIDPNNIDFAKYDRLAQELIDDAINEAIEFNESLMELP